MIIPQLDKVFDFMDSQKTLVKEACKVLAANSSQSYIFKPDKECFIKSNSTNCVVCFNRVSILGDFKEGQEIKIMVSVGGRKELVFNEYASRDRVLNESFEFNIPAKCGDLVKIQYVYVDNMPTQLSSIRLYTTVKDTWLDARNITPS